MTDMNEITERLHLERDAIATSDVEGGLRRVRGIARRRRQRNSLVGVAAAGGLLVAGVGAVGLIGSSRAEVVVTDTAPAVTTDAEAPATPETSTPPITTAAPGTGVATTPEPTPVVPNVSETVVGTAVDSDLSDVTSELRAVAGDDLSDGWQVPWNEGFLIGGQSSQSDGSAAFFSPDGRTWEEIALEPGINGPSQYGVTVADGRLVMLGTVGDWPRLTPVVASTTDLTTWTIEEIPVTPPPSDLPPTVDAWVWPGWIAATADGWIATVYNSLEVNTSEVASQRLGRPVNGGSIASSDEGFLLTVEPEIVGGESEEVWIAWTELEEELGSELADEIRERDPNEIWTSTWADTTPLRIDGPDDLDWVNSVKPPIAFENGLAAVRTTQEFPDDGPPVYTSELFANPDDGGWVVLDAPIPERVEYAFPVDGDLGVVAKANDGTISIYRVDVDTETWTPVDVPRLPERARYIQTSSTSVFDLDAAPPDDFENRPSTQVFDQNGLRLTWIYDSYISSYEVTSLETGDAVVAESIDIREVDGSFDLAFDHLTGGLALDVTITDPETGDVLMNITAEEMAAANPQEPYYGPDPEPWIVATDDGITWFVYEVPPSDPDRGTSYAEAMTVSGGRLLYRSDAREWFVVDLV